MKGQSLIEVLVALGIISLVATGIATIVTQALSNTQYSKDQGSATKYAQEGLEIVRTIRDGNYSAFDSLNGIYCLAKNTESLGVSQSACSSPNVDQFIREVNIVRVPGCGPNVSEVTVTVSWTDGKCSAGSFCHNTKLATCLSRVTP